jgi:hypothetical protein
MGHHEVIPTIQQQQMGSSVNTRQKLRFTLESVGWPMVQSGLSTILCVCPLAFINVCCAKSINIQFQGEYTVILLILKKYAPTVFVNTVFLVCIIGVCHGLIILPSFMCTLPSYCANSNFYANAINFILRRKQQTSR